jgi:ribonuclease Y
MGHYIGAYLTLHLPTGTVDPAVWPVAGIVGVVAVGLGWLAHLVWERRRMDAARRGADAILSEATTEAARLKRDADLAAKEELLRRRQELEHQAEVAQQELKEQANRLTKREDLLDRKHELMTKKEKSLDEIEDRLKQRDLELDERAKEVDRLIAQEKDTLFRITGLGPEEARQVLLTRLETEVTHEASVLVNRVVGQAQEEAERKAKEILTTAIQRCAADHTVENVVSAVDLPGDEMKGRIIGREGRNIRAFERATGIDVIVDDTPGVVVVSGFDPVRREIARRSLEKLISDGRIHPARIEEVVAEVTKEVNEVIVEAGKQASMDADVHGLNPKEIGLLGRLRFRTSYGQSVLQHSLEVAYLSSTIAGELGLDVKLAKRCGLLHDIGKAVDHEVEGGHPQIGAELARRYGEAPEVINAIEGHHEDVPATSLYTVIVGAADAISAARPGARRETLEKYIKRLQRLEELARGFEGVDSAYAIQAGREVRVIVDANKVSDKDALRVCRDIAKQIEKELSYPGEVKVTLIRETRAVEYAR